MNSLNSNNIYIQLAEYLESSAEQKIRNLSLSEHQGIQGTLKREVATRVLGVALSVLAVATFALRIIGGLTDLIEGTFYSLANRQIDTTIFSKNRAESYFLALAKNFVAIVTGSIGGAISPIFGEFIITPQLMPVLTDGDIKRTDQKTVDLIYDTLENFDSICHEHDIKYTLWGRSALGQQRNGGLIPWDHKAEVVIEAANKSKLLSELTERSNSDVSIIDDKKNEKIKIVNKTTQKVLLEIKFLKRTKKNDKLYLISDQKKVSLQSPQLLVTEWEQTSAQSFGHLTLSSLSNSTTYLNRTFGSDWKTKETLIFGTKGSLVSKKFDVFLTDRTHATRSVCDEDATIDHQQLAETLDTEENRASNNLHLQDFFGTVQVVNLDRSQSRLAKFKAHMAEVGLTESHINRFSATDGRDPNQIDDTQWSRAKSNIVNNHKMIIPVSTEKQTQLKKQFQAQTGCYMTHYRVIKMVSENYDQAINELNRLKRDPKSSSTELSSAKEEVRKWSSVLIFEDDAAFGTIEPGPDTKRDGSNLTSETKSMKKVSETFFSAMKSLPKNWDMLYFMALQSPQKPGKKTESEHLLRLENGLLCISYAINHTMYHKTLNRLRDIENPYQRLRAVDIEIGNLHAENNCYLVNPAIIVEDDGGDSTIVGTQSKGIKFSQNPS